MLGIGTQDLIMSLTLAHSVLAWWEDNKDEMYIDSLDRDCDYKLYPKEPEFVKLAKELING